MKTAIIGGSGLNKFPEINMIDEIFPDTPWGKPSAPIQIGILNKTKIIFLPRHGEDNKIAPHKINYKANIWALHEINVRNIISVSVVGGITKSMSPNNIIIPDQIIDYTYNRDHTFSDGDPMDVEHIDFSNPYSEILRKKLIDSARVKKLKIHPKGTYGITQGPRLETAAEILRLENDGCNIVGMTGMPEASLARELKINYACCCLVVNWAAGKSTLPITSEVIQRNLEGGLHNILLLINEFLLNAN
jgi:5'-methylthioinosine phosphorylase